MENQNIENQKLELADKFVRDTNTNLYLKEKNGYIWFNTQLALKVGIV